MKAVILAGGKGTRLQSVISEVPKPMAPVGGRPFLEYLVLQLRAWKARVWELYRLGVFRELYFRKDRPGAVLILECADIEEAGHVLKTLPLVREALIDFDIIPLKPYPGFARLFAEYA